MYLVNTRDQMTADHFIYDTSGTITSNNVPQLIMPQMLSRSSLEIINMSGVVMYLGFGGATATCAISGGKVSTITVTNVGFNYTLPPKVIFIGGGNNGSNQQNSTFLGGQAVNYPAPQHPATGTCVMGGSGANKNVASITITDPGIGYAIAPIIFLQNDPNDPYGAFLPSATNPGSIILGATGGNYYRNHTNCFIDAVSVVCATSTSVYTAKYMP